MNFDADPLPLNFPQTFLPDRRLLGQLLAFVERDGQGDKETIGSATGIPTGRSTGKVEPMIRYARGMGLIDSARSDGIWHLRLTPLGDVVRQEDAFLSEPVTLWLLHLLLSRRAGRGEPARGIADAWYALFAEGQFRLGQRFSQTEYLDLLRTRHGAKGYLKALSALVPRMYLEDSSFAAISALSQESAGPEPTFARAPAPAETAFFPVYALFFYRLWDEAFALDRQLLFDDFSRETRFLALLNWTETPLAFWLEWMVDKGLVQIDRYTGTPILLRLKETSAVARGIYSELI